MTHCAYCGSPIHRPGAEVRWAGEPYHRPCLDFIASADQRRAEVQLAAMESHNRVEAVMPFRNGRASVSMPAKREEKK